MEPEKLDMENILEVEKIKKILHSVAPDLLEIFEMILHIANQQINQEKTCVRIEIEDNDEPELSDHESDDD